MFIITKLKEWQNLQAHYDNISSQHMRDWFAKDPNRFNQLSINVGDIFFDYSKNRITQDTIRLLTDLAKARKLGEKIKNLFDGSPINNTENRPALHTALRNLKTESLVINKKNIMPDIKNSLQKMHQFSESIRNKTWLGSTGKPITDIINIGIGGSHLGPMTTVEALSQFAKKDLKCHFISNIDPEHLYEILNLVNLETTIVIVSSKSFNTLETITNTTTILSIFKNKLPKFNINKHFIAVTHNRVEAIKFGISNENIFFIENFIGGRYSIWSPIGLPLAIMIGMNNFEELLAGAFAMDEHFKTTDFDKNIPVIMALISIWYINFFNTSNHAIVTYSHNLQNFRNYLQQLEMESNGKQTSQNGDNLTINTCPVIFGEQGSNAQHSFHQLFHQSPHLIPVDFILAASSDTTLANHYKILISSALSQSQALMRGKTYNETYAELISEGLDKNTASFMAKHKEIPGNKPNNMIVLNKLTPKSLGSLIALYEHKTFVQGVIWGINSFDQFGVELGKSLLPEILKSIHYEPEPSNKSSKLDSSTLGLVKYFNLMRSD